MTTAPAAPTRRLCWIYPDRGTDRMRDKEWKHVWGIYREVAREGGWALSLHKPEEVAVDVCGPGGPKVYLDGERVTPEDTVFVTSLWSLPHHTVDVCNQLYLYTILEQAGFYLPIPPHLSFIANDKAATMLHLADSPLPQVPTVRIGTGRDTAQRSYEAALASLSYPAIVKPAYWGMGMGVCLVRNAEELKGVAGIASGADTALVCQPYLGEGINDFRVWVVGGKPHTVLRRIPKGASLTANLSSGGGMEHVPLPPELAETVDYVAARMPMPYIAVDFLWDGERFWLSEVEPDGAVGFADSEQTEREQRKVIADRFAAYADAHRQFLNRKDAIR
ncbi:MULTISPECIES: ATP-grasp domain-containing protein [Kitasatospora]|uniref:ATP-dependent carboxylate-amide ligase n=1 Tax=Kitasatospora cystarginea TaxID=58350 RepID=A0A1W6R558_9ACTN|nr:ATP-dependent carboxylate-amide ligase [Kitasatospora cystarginea]